MIIRLSRYRWRTTYHPNLFTTCVYAGCVIRIILEFCNNSYYAKGYTDGYQKSQDSVSVTYQYHQHTGDSTSGTGCYTKAITKTVQTGTENYSYHPTVSDDDGNGTENCGNCGTKIYTGPYGSTECGCLCTGSRPVYGTVVDHYEINCGKTTSTIERAIIIF